VRYIEFDGGACDRDAGMRVDSLIQIRCSGAVGSPAMISCLIGAGAVPLIAIAIAPGASGARWRSQQGRSLTPGPPSSEPGSWGQGQGAAIVVA